MSATKRGARRVAAGLVAAAGGAAASAQCTPHWSLLPMMDEFACCVNALAVYDDGSGPALYAAGDFAQAGGVAANGIARWDGQAWHSLGAGVSGVVYALTVFDPDGPGPLRPELVAAGGFSAADGQPVAHIARWNGQVWSALGGGTPDFYPMALVSWDRDGPGPAPT